MDLNDPQTLQFYSQLLLFRDDLSRDALIFPSTLSPAQRRVVHTLAHHMVLAHVSRGTGEQRQVHVYRAPANNLTSSVPAIPTTVHPVESQRRGLNRAATMDFTDARGSDPGAYSTIGRQTASLLDIPGSPGRDRQNLRPAKSFADLRSYTPSPVPSSASFPAALGAGISRYIDYGGNSVASTTPSLTPTATGTTISGNRDDSLLLNGLANMSLSSGLGGNLGVGGANLRDPRGLQGMDRENQNPVGTGIGASFATRAYNLGYENQLREQERREQERGQVLPLRQPRGPESARGAGFDRSRQQNGHQNGNRQSGGDLDVQSGVEILVE